MCRNHFTKRGDHFIFFPKNPQPFHSISFFYCNGFVRENTYHFIPFTHKRKSVYREKNIFSFNCRIVSDKSDSCYAEGLKTKGVLIHRLRARFVSMCLSMYRLVLNQPILRDWPFSPARPDRADCVFWPVCFEIAHSHN